MISTSETRAAALGVWNSIHAEPEKHNQSEFGNKSACGTTLCIAGFTLLNNKPESVKWVKSRWDDSFYLAPVDLPEDSSNLTGMIPLAGDILGLNEIEAHDLFMTMDKELALEKLKKIVIGEDFYLTD